MNRRQIAKDNARKAALIQRLKQPNPPTSIASLAASYGLPETEVARILRGNGVTAHG
ncbi:MAG: hypothetical protein WCZ66_12020 [Sphingomonadaceae bacterium]